jgi:hypothetical protein
MIPIGILIAGIAATAILIGGGAAAGATLTAGSATGAVTAVTGVSMRTATDAATSAHARRAGATAVMSVIVTSVTAVNV